MRSSYAHVRAQGYTRSVGPPLHLHVVAAHGCAIDVRQPREFGLQVRIAVRLDLALVGMLAVPVVYSVHSVHALSPTTSQTHQRDSRGRYNTVIREPRAHSTQVRVGGQSHGCSTCTTRPMGAKPMLSRFLLSRKLMKSWLVREFGPEVANTSVPLSLLCCGSKRKRSACQHSITPQTSRPQQGLGGTFTGSSLMVAPLHLAAMRGSPEMPNCATKLGTTRKKRTPASTPRFSVRHVSRRTCGRPCWWGSVSHWCQCTDRGRSRSPRAP
eukprot:scaffold719_cov359-Prasinococcus_capsulatus_cf.AAC.7